MYDFDKSPLDEKSTAFAVRITRMVEYLQNNRSKAFISIYNQILRSGTSIMANVGEAQFAQSGADFISKLHIALKEANETRKWLFVLHNSQCITDNEYNSMNAECNEIVAMLVSSLNTKKRNLEIEKLNNNKMES